MFVLKIFVLYDNLTRVQLHNMCVNNILGFIFVLFDEYEKFLTAKTSQITVRTAQYKTVPPGPWGVPLSLTFLLSPLVLFKVKDFGRAGRTKYTHLVDQDTTEVSYAVS